MNLAAEVLAEETKTNEVYAQSLSAISRLGESVVKGAVSVEFLQYKPEYTEAFLDFETAIAEHLSTDKDYGDRLIFSKPRAYKIGELGVQTETGDPVIGLVKNGRDAAELAAKKDPDMKSQHVRDEADVLIAEEVNRLEVGEVLHAVSLDPKEDIARSPKKWLEMGYRPGMAVVQVYYRSDNNTMLTWTTCIKKSNKLALSKIYEQMYDVIIDPKQLSNTWIRNFAKYSTTIEDAQNIGLEVQARHQELIGDKTNYKSTTQFVHQQKSVLREYFDTYIGPLAQANVTGINNKTMQSLALQILKTVDDLTPAATSALIKIGNSHKFNDEDSRFMEQMVRFAATSELKESLSDFMNGKERVVQVVKNYIDSNTINTNTVAISAVMDDQRLNEMNRRMALNTNRAAKNNESWGGCMGSTSKTNNKDRVDELELGPQDIFGGATNDKKLADSDQYGSLEFYCTDGHKNTRKRGELLDCCQKKGCAAQVCAPKDVKVVKREQGVKNKKEDNILRVIFGRDGNE